MDPDKYRAEYEQLLDTRRKERREARERLAAAGGDTRESMAMAAPAESEDEARLGMRVLADGTQPEDSRISALRMIAVEVAKRPELIDPLLQLLRDTQQPPALRRAVLGVVQAASFRAALFQEKRPQYLDTLRAIVDDPDAELRRRALEVLAKEHDEYVQRRLLEGLENPAGALVPPEHAVRLLGYDVHAGHFPILKRIVESPPNPQARREAVRLLGADPTAKGLLAGILANRQEDQETRNISAAALQSLAPGEFAAEAARILTDEGEDDDVRAACLSALDHFGPAPGDSRETAAFGTPMTGPAIDLDAQVRGLKEKSSSPALQEAVERYLSRRGE